MTFRLKLGHKKLLEGKRGMILGIFGTGGFGREVLELAEQINTTANRWEKIIFVAGIDGATVVQEKVVERFEEAHIKYKRDIEYIVAFGEPVIRSKIFEKLISHDCKLTTLIHPQVHISKTSIIGKGTIIGYGALISCNVKIGDNVLIQPNTNIGHDCVVSNHSVLSGLSILAGGCFIGETAYLGMGTIVKEQVRIGEGAIASMGAVVMRDIDDYMIASGNPARVMLKNESKRVFK